MNKKIKTFILTAVFSACLLVSSNVTVFSQTTEPVKTQVKTETIIYTPVNSLDVAANPTKYLNKKIKLRAKFDKFSTLGLDYKPAFRSSEKYITFLIKRDDVINHAVPLSEMKNFLKRDIAEKYIDLKPGDEIEYEGYVFSDALSDTWVEVESFRVLNETFKDKKPAKK